MNKRAKNNIVLFIAFVYMVFACLYVVTCGGNRAHSKVVHSSAAISGMKSLPHKAGSGFLSRPRVVRQKLVNEFIVTIVAVCLFAIITDCFSRQIKYANTTLLASRPPKIILFKNIRL
jgi:hypothetical protein